MTKTNTPAAAPARPVLYPRNPVLRAAVKAAVANLKPTVYGAGHECEQYMNRISHEALYGLLTRRARLDDKTVAAAMKVARNADTTAAAVARNRVAAHEAAHAVVGLEMGLTIRAASLAASGVELGRVQFYPRHNQTPEESWAFAVTALAGAHGEQHLLGLSSKPVMGDSEIVLSNILHLANIGWSPNGHPADFSELLSAAIQEAKEQVRIGAADIAVLAAAVAADPAGEISGLDVVTLLARFTGKTYPVLVENRAAQESQPLSFCLPFISPAAHSVSEPKSLRSENVR